MTMTNDCHNGIKRARVSPGLALAGPGGTPRVRIPNTSFSRTQGEEVKRLQLALAARRGHRESAGVSEKLGIQYGAIFGAHAM